MHIEFEQLTSATHPHFEEMWTLYENAFPTNERRDADAFIQILSSDTRFACQAVVSDGIFIGLLNWWNLGQFAYIEHFAIQPNLRNHGMGGLVLNNFLAHCNLPTVLEVETPSSTLARRRIAFYAKHGLRLLCSNYMQPPYRPTDAPTPMFILGNKDTFTSANVRLLKQAVYGID